MAIAVGDKVPDVEVRTLGADGMPQTVQTGEVLGSGKVVLFAVPGAFTPGCSKVHLPGFVQGGLAVPPLIKRVDVQLASSGGNSLRAHHGRGARVDNKGRPRTDRASLTI